MKSYDEMTQSVLVRAEKERIVQKRRNRNIVLSVIAGVCCLTCAILVGMRLNTPEPQDPMLNDVTVSTAPEPSTTETDPISKKSHEITLLNMSEDGTYVQMVNDVNMPLYAQFRIRDVRGLTDAEIDKVRREEESAANAIFAQIKGDSSIAQFSGHGAVISTFFVGKIGVLIEDFTLVEDVSITTTSVGSLIRDTAIYNDSNARLYAVTWLPSYETRELICEDPTIKPSQFRDTITFTITYKDGAVGTAVVDLTFDDEGMAYITQRGITVN